MTPAIIFAARSPGQSISETLVVNNQSSQELAFDLAAEDMVIEQGRMVPIPAGQSPNGIASTVTLSSPTLSVKPWRTTSFQITLKVPSDSPVRGVLIVLKGTRTIPAAGGITLQASLGTLITFVEPDVPGPPAGSAAHPTDSLMTYTVSQWHTE